MTKIYVNFDLISYSGTLHINCFHVQHILQLELQERPAQSWREFRSEKEAEEHLNKVMLRILRCNYCFEK